MAGGRGSLLAHSPPHGARRSSGLPVTVPHAANQANTAMQKFSNTSGGCSPFGASSLGLEVKSDFVRVSSSPLFCLPWSMK